MKMMPTSIVQSEAELREYIGYPTKDVEGKKLPVLESVSREFIAHSPFVCVTTRQTNGSIDLSARGGLPGFVHVLDDRTLLIPDHSDNRLSDSLENIQANPFIGLIFFIPVVNETLRINGGAHVVRDKAVLATHFPENQCEAAIAVTVVESYLHCAKAFIRSHLWDSAAHVNTQLTFTHKVETVVRRTELDEQCQMFIRNAPFLCLGSSLVEGGADISPRGDPNGFVMMPSENTLLIPDRPGNRLADNFHNILVNPLLGVMFFVPGIDWALTVHGRASIVKDPELLEPLTVQGKRPALGIWMDIEEVLLAHNQALQLSLLWNPQVRIARKDFPSFGQMIAKQLAFLGSLSDTTADSLDRFLESENKKWLY